MVAVPRGGFVKKRFLFTQTTAPLIGCIAGYAVFKVFKLISPSWYQKDNILHVIILGSIIVASCVSAIFLWGRVLVLLGVLSKEEGKGYPYSKPWIREQNRPVGKGQGRGR
jgi:hypothetical protein